MDSLVDVNETPIEEFLKKKMEDAYKDLKRTNPELAELIMKG